MRKIRSSFEAAETFIGRGQSVEGFMPALLINNTGEKLPQPQTLPVAAPSPTMAPMIDFSKETSHAK